MLEAGDVLTHGLAPGSVRTAGAGRDRSYGAVRAVNYDAVLALTLSLCHLVGGAGGLHWDYWDI